MARAFAKAGCSRFAITDLNKGTLADTRDALREINPKAHIHASCGDVADEGFVGSFVKEAVGVFDRIDYSVQCAGILGKGLRSHEIPVRDFDYLNKVNYRGSWLVTRQVLGHMMKQEPLPDNPKQRGAIVNIASQLALVARTEAAAYCASKAAVVNMTKADAIDYSPDSIRVNCVCPGVIATPMTVGSQGVLGNVRGAIDVAPMKRMGTPEEVANSVLFLCSSQASFIQGHALVVDGGYTIN